MKLYAIIPKRLYGQTFQWPLEVSDEIQISEALGEVCVEIDIERPDEFFQPYEIPITDHYDRLFSIPADLLNEGAIRLVTEQEVKAWEEETNDRIPLP